MEGTTTRFDMVWPRHWRLHDRLQIALKTSEKKTYDKSVLTRHAKEKSAATQTQPVVSLAARCGL